MTPAKDIIILFEDNEAIGTKIETAIRSAIPPNTELIRFQPEAEASLAAYEDRIRLELSKAPYANATLIVSDRDLSATKGFGGLSEAVISKVANHMAIPVALYATGYTDELLERKRQFGDARIVVNTESIGSQVAVLTSGFSALKRALPNVLKIQGYDRPRSPAAVMAHLLEHPELSDHIGLYGAGDQKMVSEILPFAEKKQRSALEARLPCLLGYWLYDSILRFPGLLVNSVAAASYLNISPDNIRDPDITRIFSPALYTGPFHDKNDPIWWRNILDEILQNAKCTDGNELVEKTLGKKVNTCNCSVDPRKRAGWYCIATQRPVSLEESQGNISWFPAGADLCRIRQDVYDEVGPWLGLY